MLDIIVFAFGIMYTPGPVNMVALFSGVNNQGLKTLVFNAGVGCAMFILFLLIGYLGSGVVTQEYQSVAALVGGVYITYLGYKLLRASFHIRIGQQKDIVVTFWSGLTMQLTNPKAALVIIPIVTVQFPQAQIVGAQIALWSFIMGCMAFGAPSSYFFVGHYLKRFALDPKVMVWVYRIMALLLWYVAYQFVVAGLSLWD